MIWWLDQTMLWTGKIQQGSIGHPNFKLGDDNSLTISGLKDVDTGKFNCTVLHNDHIQSVVYDVHIAGIILIYLSN